MYSIDGIPLKNSTYGWRLKMGSNPFTSISRSLVDFNASGRDGTVQVRGFSATPTITLQVTSNLTWLDDLKQLFTLGSALTVTADGSQTATVELVSLTVTPWVLTGSTSAGPGLYLVTAVMRLPYVYWRDTNTVTYGPTNITSSGQTVNVFPLSSAPVRDALISVGGSITGLNVAASVGTYFSYPPNVPAGTFLTFDSSNGRAWTGASAFTETTEVTGSIANGRPPYFLELVGVSNPAVTGSNLVVTYSSASGATISVRGKNAYDN